jgi:hypothetical protein
MARTIADAFLDAEAKIERDRRIVPEIISMADRATAWEHLSAWDKQTVDSLMRSVTAHRSKHGFPDIHQSDEDAMQDAIVHALEYSNEYLGKLDPAEFKAVMVWRAARRWGRHFSWVKEEKKGTVLSLDASRSSDPERDATQIDFAGDHRPEESAEWLLEWWYLKTYVRHLLKTTSKTTYELATEFGVQPWAIQTIAAGLRRDEGTGDGIPMAADQHPRTKEHCIRLLRSFVANYGRSPTYKEMQERTLELPPARHIFELFGSREAAFAAAGIEAPSLRGKKADKRLLGEELVAWVRTHDGHWPSLREIEQASDLRGGATYQTHFGTVAKEKLYDAIREIVGDDALAGISRPIGREARTWRRGKVIEAASRFHQENGRWPRQSDFNANEGLPAANSVQRVLGTTDSKKIAAIVEQEAA